MAINRKTLDAARHTMVFRQTTDGGLIDLHFDLVNLDGQTFYQPVWPGRMLEDGTRQRGVFTAPLILDQNRELPFAASPSEALGKGQFATWFYGDGA